MDLLPVVSQAIAFTAYAVSLGIGLMFLAVALARISVDFFKS